MHSQTNLGVLYAKGLGVRQDYKIAREWYEKAATQGGADAQFNLGFLYLKGLGVRQDMKAAQEWYGKSCDNGIQEGCDRYRILIN